MRKLWRQWRLRCAVKRAEADNLTLADEVGRLREQLETEQVKGRILQVEVDHLTAALARGLARWEADVKVSREER